MSTIPLASTRPDVSVEPDEGSYDTRLKALLLGRHLHPYSRFCRVYDKTARGIDPSWIVAYPSRTTLHRWVNGQMARLPSAQHCEVLEAMFPGWSADELFEPAEPEDYQRPTKTGEPITRVAGDAVVPGPVVERWTPCAHCSGYGVVRERGVPPVGTQSGERAA
jgi:hypothetical protein